MLKRIPNSYLILAGYVFAGFFMSVALLLTIESAAYEAALSEDTADDPAIWTQSTRTRLPENPDLVRTSHMVPASSTLSQTLKSAGLTGAMIRKLVDVSKPHADLGNIPSKTVLSLFWDRITMKQLKRVEYPISKTERLVIEQVDGADDWQANVAVTEVDRRVETYSGLVDNSLWNSAVTSGIDASVIARLADIFAWQVNFSREIHSGDSWRIAIERDYVDGRPIRWGNILAAEFVNGGETFTGIRYEDAAGRAAYYDSKGESLKRLFLKSPVRFSRISSGFTSRRMHPILGINRPHNGVDYAAPTGTPVRAVGDGQVIHASYDSASGNMVKIVHNSTYSTSYHHLSRFAPGIRLGQKVTQGDIIGYVGSTGLATGPHLHFAFYENGIYVDPQGLKFPSADPVPPSELPEFLAVADQALRSLPDRGLALTQVTRLRDQIPFAPIEDRGTLVTH